MIILFSKLQKRSIFFVILVFLNLTVVAQNIQFTRGADISWCTEMEDSGKKFYNAGGIETELCALMKEIGMNAIRLRVWVNPSKFGYGAYCDKADVIAKAKRADAQGLDIMIDFHYSDFFTDPGKQTIPTDWSGYTFEQIKTAIREHTQDVLQALKDEGIEPKWVQVGNEINSGMLWPMGQIDWTKTGNAQYQNFVTLFNAGYDAVKEIFPDSYVILHRADAVKSGEYDGWFFKQFKNAGGKFDMIGLSHYPDYSNWNSTASNAVSNINAANSVKSLGTLYNVPVMIVETGYSSYDAARAKNVMQDLLNRMTAIEQCAGVFYWEPEVDGQWKPQYYQQVGWGAYNMGAFTTAGKPSAALDPFNNSNTSVDNIHADAVQQPIWYDIQGRAVQSPACGLYIIKNGSQVKKIYPRCP